MKVMLKLISTAAACLLAASVLTACGGDKAADNSANALTTPPPTAITAPSGSAGVNYANPSITIRSGDYELMKSFVDEMVAGRYDGKVVKIYGFSVRSSFGAKATIMESDGEGARIGATYRIIGATDIDSYPAEEAQVELTGVVKADENGGRFIEVPEDKLIVSGSDFEQTSRVVTSHDEDEDGEVYYDDDEGEQTSTNRAAQTSKNTDDDEQDDEEDYDNEQDNDQDNDQNNGNENGQESKEEE